MLAYLLFLTPHWRNPVSFQAYITLISFQPHNQPDPYHMGSEATVEGLLPGARCSAFKCQLDLTRVTCLWESHPTSENLSFSTCKMGPSLEPVLLTSQDCGDHPHGWYKCGAKCRSHHQKLWQHTRTGYILSATVQFYWWTIWLTLECQLAWLCLDWSLMHSDEEGLPCSKLLLLKLFHTHESPGILLKCSFWFRRPEMGLESLHFSQTPRSHPCWWGEDPILSSKNLRNIFPWRSLDVMLHLYLLASSSNPPSTVLNNLFSSAEIIQKLL